MLNKDLLTFALDAKLPTAVEQIGFNLLAQFRAGSLSAQALFELLKRRKETNFPWQTAIKVTTYYANPQMVTIMMAVLKEFALAVNVKAAETGSTLNSVPADFVCSC